MRFQLISITKKVLVSESIDSVVVPTKTGVMTLLPRHEPLVSALNPGILKVTIDGKTTNFAVGGGVLETDGTEVTILADMVEEGDSCDLDEAKKRKEEAVKLLKEAREAGTSDMAAVIALEEELMKQEARVKLAEGTI